MAPANDAAMLVSGAIAIGALIVLIARCKLNPFIALVTVSLLLGLVVGLPAATLVKAFETGVGNTLGHIALVVGLGSILGKIMVESGGAERISATLVSVFGPRRADWAMMTVALIVGLPVFFEVGFVLLVPIAFTVAAATRMPLIRIALPMTAGLSVVHAIVPPHPAALLAVTAFHADIGSTILYALIVGIPAAMIAGPLFARAVSPHIALALPDTAAAPPAAADTRLPGFAITVATLLLPVFLMLLGSAAGLFAAPASPVFNGLALVGNSVVALLIAVFVSFRTLGRPRGFDSGRLLAISQQALAPTATITLVVGAGAGFGRILIDSGMSVAIVHITAAAHLPVLLLGWLIAALLRVATGSATVAMATAAGIVAPIAAVTPGIRPELLVLTTGAGSVVLSHINDGGFWLVKEYLGLTIEQTFKTWTVCETLISVLVLLFTLGLSVLLG